MIVDRSREELLEFISASTIIPCDRKNYGKIGEFRGSVWQNGFQIALNTGYFNSFESEALCYVDHLNDDQCIVHCKIGINPLVLTLMCIWNFGLVVALIGASIKVASYNGIATRIAAMLVFLPFISMDFIFLRFALYSNYKKLKRRMLDILNAT